MSALFRNDARAAYPDSWYAATCDLPNELPPLPGAQTADVCVIGAGYAGMSAALELARQGMDVVLLDAHRPGFGASGRNGGQMGSGFNRSQLWLEQRMGSGPARALWDMAEAAKALTRAQVAAHAPDARLTPGVLHGAWTQTEADELRAEADHLASYGYDQIEPLDNPGDVVRSPVYVGGTLDMGAGHLHPLRYAVGLARACASAGVRRFDRSAVHHIAHGARPVVRTDTGHVTCDHVIIAGNGYLNGIDRQTRARVMPINSFIAATEPLPQPVLTRDIAVADSKFVVNYFRQTPDGRLLFGGRESYSIGFPRDITTRLRARMAQLFPQIADVPFAHVWGGTLGITMTRLPLLTRSAPNVLSIGGFSGHGVALSGFSGHIAAKAIAGQADQFDLLSTLPTPAFPGGGMLRAPILSAAMGLAVLRDRLS